MRDRDRRSGVLRVTTVAVLTRTQATAAALGALLPDHEFLQIDPRGSLGEAAAAEVAIGGNDPERLKKLLAVAPRLRWYSAMVTS